MGYDASVKFIGIRPPDAEWKKKVAAWQACKDAGIYPPDELNEFFGDRPPSAEGAEFELPHEIVECKDDDEAEEYSTYSNGGGGSYYLIDLKKIPKQATHIKVWLSESY